MTFDISKLLQQFQQMQGELRKTMEAAQAQVCAGEAGAGLVRAEANGKGEIVTITLDPKLMEEGDAELIADLVRGACNLALKRARDAVSTRVGSVSGGLSTMLGGLGGFDLPDGPGEE